MQGDFFKIVSDLKFFLGDLSNDVTLTAFRLLVSDLLALFQPLNEGVMNVLSRLFLDLSDDRSLFRDVTHGCGEIVTDIQDICRENE